METYDVLDKSSETKATGAIAVPTNAISDNQNYVEERDQEKQTYHEEKDINELAVNQESETEDVDVGSDTGAVGDSTLCDVAETLHNAYAAVLGDNDNMNSKTAGDLPDTETGTSSDSLLAKSNERTAYDQNNNEVLDPVTNSTTSPCLADAEPELEQIHGMKYSQSGDKGKTQLKHGSPESVKPGLTDHNNNEGSRPESVHTPENDGLISPEVFHLTHLSPTLYGYENTLMMVPRPCFSRSGSTLNTPELPCIEALDHRDIFTPFSSNSTPNHGQMKRKMSYDFPQEQTENPLYFDSTDSQVSSASDPKYARYIDNSYSVYNTYSQYGYPQSFDYRANQSCESVSRSSCQYPGWNANQIMATTNRKSHAACRLDFESPVDLSNKLEGRVEPKNCMNMGSYGVHSSSVPQFISSQACLAENLTRPQPVVPVKSSSQHFSGIDIGYGLNTSAQVSPYNFTSFGASQSSSFIPAYQQGLDHSASYAPFLYTNMQSPSSSADSNRYTSLRNNNARCETFPNDQNGNDTSRGEHNKVPSAYDNHRNLKPSCTHPKTSWQTERSKPSETFTPVLYQDLALSEHSESPMFIATPLDRINNNTNTGGGSSDTVSAVVAKDREKSEVDKTGNINEQHAPEKSVNVSDSGDENHETHEDIKSQDDIDSSGSDTCKPSMDMVVPIKVQNKNVAITVSELSSKTVRQLFEKANVKESDEDNYDIEVSRRKNFKCNKAFLARYEKERKQRASSPLSAFCAALECEKKPPENRSLLPAIAEPRIPIQTLLAPNEVPMMRSGSTLVPYFNNTTPAILPTYHCAPQQRIVTPIGLRSTPPAYPLYRNISNVRVADPHTLCPTPIQLPLNMAVPLYANPVTTATPLQAVPAQQTRKIRPKPSTRSQSARDFNTTATVTQHAQNTAAGPLAPQIISHTLQVPESCRATKPQHDKKFKAKHYNFVKLTIGKYKYTCDLHCSDRGARIKFLYSKKQLIYEYQMDDSVSFLTERTMLEVVIPFHTICQISLENSEMKLELTHAPAMYKGIRGPLKTGTGNLVNQTTQYNRHSMVDETNGQLTKCPYHCLRFKTSCHGKIQSDLSAFSRSFKKMCERPFIHDPWKTYRGLEVSIRSSLLHPDIALPTEHNSSRAFTEFTSRLGYNRDSPKTQCHCIEDCSLTRRCRCCMEGVKCTVGWCKCSKCQNPLNVLHSVGSPVDKIITDQCLMDNIYQISNLATYLTTVLRLECCDVCTQLCNCIPGLVSCPHTNCPYTYKFSWCTAKLCNEGISPRNHCVQCKRCTDYRNIHCQKCNTCYFAGEHGAYKCPTCITNSETNDDDDDDDDTVDDDDDDDDYDETTEISTDSTD